MDRDLGEHHAGLRIATNRSGGARAGAPLQSFREGPELREGAPHPVGDRPPLPPESVGLHGAPQMGEKPSRRSEDRLAFEETHPLFLEEPSQ